MIWRLSCGHSMDTTDRRYKADACWYCAYLLLHPRPMGLGRARTREKSKKVVRDARGRIGG